MSAHTMKAAVLVSNGMGFRVTNVLRPQSGRGEVLVRIAASGVSPLDTKMFNGAAEHARHAPSESLGGDEWWTARRIQAWLQLQS